MARRGDDGLPRAVGTVDQAMMGALKVRHAHMRAACLARNLLVVDEVHPGVPRAAQPAVGRPFPVRRRLLHHHRGS